MTTEHLSREHGRTLQAIFQHPAPHNLEWRHIMALLEAIGMVTEEHNGDYQVTVNGQIHTMHRPRHKHLADIEELVDVRHFLVRADVALNGLHHQEQPQTVTPRHMVVVIDHQETRVYETEFKGTQPERLHPSDPHGELHHLHHTNGNFEGQRAPEDPQYYERLAQRVHDADTILIFGNGKGKASAMMQFVRYLTKHHTEIADRIVGAVVVDVEALTENQLLAEARDFYAEEVAADDAAAS